MLWIILVIIETALLIFFFFYHRKKEGKRQLERECLLVLLDKWHEEIEGLSEKELRIWTSTITDTLSLSLQKNSDSNVRQLLSIKEDYPRLYQILVEYEQDYTL